MFKRFLLGCTPLLATLAMPAAAQTVQGIYVGLGAGGTMLNESINRRSPTGFFGLGNGSQFTYRTGTNVSASMGWGFGNGVRAELEGYWRRAGIEEARLFSQGSFNGGISSRSGTAQVYGFMANAYYDFDLTVFGPQWRWLQPYIGAGLGFAYSQFRDLSMDTYTSLRTTVNGNGRTLAYQAILGAAVPLDDVLPGLSLLAEYRYFGAGAPRLRTETRTIPTQAGQTAYLLSDVSRNVSPAIGSHNISIGLRYAFNAPGAAGSAPVAAAAPLGFGSPQFAAPAAAPRSYAVYFGNRGAALDATGRDTVSQAARTAMGGGVSGLDVVGSADGAPNAANRALANRRAQAVVAELVRQGIPRTAITISAVGGQGPTDPQLRRVDITLR